MFARHVHTSVHFMIDHRNTTGPYTGGVVDDNDDDNSETKTTTTNDAPAGEWRPLRVTSSRVRLRAFLDAYGNVILNRFDDPVQVYGALHACSKRCEKVARASGYCVIIHINTKYTYARTYARTCTRHTYSGLEPRRAHSHRYTRNNSQIQTHTHVATTREPVAVISSAPYRQRAFCSGRAQRHTSPLAGAHDRSVTV